MSIAARPMAHGAGPFTCTANGVHTRQLMRGHFHPCLTWLPVTLTDVSCDAQDHHELRICTSSQLPTRRKKPLAAVALLLFDGPHACVRVRRPARAIRVDQKLIASVHRRPHTSGGYQYSALLASCTKSEYAEPLVLAY